MCWCGQKDSTCVCTGEWQTLCACRKKGREMGKDRCFYWAHSCDYKRFGVSSPISPYTPLTINSTPPQNLVSSSRGCLYAAFLHCLSYLPPDAHSSFYHSESSHAAGMSSLQHFVFEPSGACSPPQSCHARMGARPQTWVREENHLLTH